MGNLVGKLIQTTGAKAHSTARIRLCAFAQLQSSREQVACQASQGEDARVSHPRSAEGQSPRTGRSVAPAQPSVPFRAQLDALPQASSDAICENQAFLPCVFKRQKRRLDQRCKATILTSS